MSFNPKVSIIIPVYNGENFLREAIDSALSQTYKNIEVIVVNDGSNDGGKTEEISLSYGDKIHYFYKKNGGVATALNLGIRKAGGEYISWLSHDDLYYPNKIEVQINYLGSQENKDAILFSNFDIKNYFNNTTYTANYIRDFKYSRWNMLHLLFASRLHLCSMLIPIKCFTSTGYFSEELRTTQDYEYLFRLLKENYIFHYLSDILIITRHHKEADTHKIIDYHIRELNDLYAWAFELFIDDFQAASVPQMNDILSLMKSRGILDVFDRISGLRDYRLNKENLDGNKPFIWLYWENKKGQNTPAIITLCRNTIVKYNKKDFQIIVTNPHNIFYYLPALNKKCFLFERIAHRADYIRFNLLYEYGGIWLDSDFIAFKSLKPVLSKIEQHGFVYTGYIGADGKVFPVIHFLGANKFNPIFSALIENANMILNEKVSKGIQPEWDDIGGYKLQEIITENNSFMFDEALFAPMNVTGYGQRKIFLPVNIERYKTKKCFGQMLPYSVHSEFFNLMGVDIIKMHCYIATLLKKNIDLKESLKRLGNKIIDPVYLRIPEKFKPEVMKIINKFIGQQ